MPLQLAHRALYASFDRFPSAKGAATHIARMASTLFDVAGGGVLYVLGDEELPLYQHEGSVEIVRYPGAEPNFLERALGFGSRLEELLERHGDALEICHVRDPWSGMPVIGRPHRYATVYEVNGLPSIELPYRYPHLSSSTLAKIRSAEEFCWRHADLLITPSATIAENLVRLGADAGKITVIPNGADIPRALPEPPVDHLRGDAPARYLIYFGAVQPWQGVDLLLRAFARLADLADLHLVICASTNQRSTKMLRKLAERLGIDDRVIWHHALGKDELASWLAGALLSVAPLTECSRNLEQGCAPLKVLESMAFGVPVVAADLPAVREIMTDGVEGRLVRPDRPADLARAIRVLLEYPEQMASMGERARRRIAEDFTWGRSTDLLTASYRAVLHARGDIFAASPGAISDRTERKQSS